MRWKHCLTAFTVACSSFATQLAGCGGDDSTDSDVVGTGGTVGAGGAAGRASGGGGNAGSKAGGAGTAGAGTGGKAGAGTGGSASTGGTGGSAGTGGAAGTGGSAGTAGTGGSAGTAADAGKDTGSDVATSEAGPDATPDTSVQPDGGTPDVSVDGGPDVARDAGATVDGPTDVRVGDGGENLECKACELDQCPTYRDYCDNAAFSAAEKQTCRDLAMCVRQSSCHKSTIINCYCGNADAVTCRQGAADGACKTLIEQGLNSTDPNFILPTFEDVNHPTGAAMELMFCDTEACDDNAPPIFTVDAAAPDGAPYTPCLPYYR